MSYVCSIDHSAGKCDHNTTKQDELLKHVIDTVVDRFSNPDVVERLRDELYRQVKMTTRKTNPDAISRQMGPLDKDLVKAKRRLLQVDDDLVPILRV